MGNGIWKSVFTLIFRRSTLPSFAQLHNDKRQPVLTPSANAVTLSGCGENYCDQMLQSVETLAAQLKLEGCADKNGTLQVYTVVDDDCKMRLSRWLYKDYAASSINLEPISVSSVQKHAASRGTKLFGNERFGICASARLFLPDMVPAHRLLHIDADTRVTGPVDRAFEIMQNHSDRVMFMSEEAGTWYLRNPANRAGRTGYNSGVLGVNVDAWHKRNMTSRVREVLAEADKHMVSLWLVDQDVLNRIAQQDMSLIYTLPCEFNFRTDSSCAASPLVVHGNRGVFEAGGVWSRAAEHILSTATAVLSQAAVVSYGKTTLWDLSGVTQLPGE